MIKEHGQYFKVAFSLSGTGIEQLEYHAPQVIEKLQELNQTGCVEFLAEPYSHGLSSLANEETFALDVKKQCAKIEELFGKKPTVARNSSLIYSDDIGGQIAAMGFKGMLTEGAKHVLGWKSPHYVYNCNIAPNLKLLLRDVELIQTGRAILCLLMLISIVLPASQKRSRSSISSWSSLLWVLPSPSAPTFLTSSRHCPHVLRRKVLPSLHLRKSA